MSCRPVIATVGRRGLSSPGFEPLIKLGSMCPHPEGFWLPVGPLTSSVYSVWSEYHDHRAFWVALVVKNLPANAGDYKTRVPFPGREDPLKKGTATHSIILAWRIPWTEEPGGLQSIGVAKSRTRLSD